MSKVAYLPKIQLLHIEDDKNFYQPLSEELIRRGIYTHHVDNLESAVDIIKKCEVDLIVSDGMFPNRTGMKEEKNFLPFVAHLKKLKKSIPIIAWANSTHVHEYCKKNHLSPYSKIGITREMFARRSRAYFKVPVKIPFEMADIVEKKLIDISGFDGATSKCVLEEYYQEPVTVLGAFLACDMRTQMFKET